MLLEKNNMHEVDVANLYKWMFKTACAILDVYKRQDFDRPQFEKMMEEVRKGRVNCIVVKDLSRFGRNYRCV